MVKWPFRSNGPDENKRRVYWHWTQCLPNEIAHMHRLKEAGRQHVISSIHASYQIAGITGFMTHQHNMDVIARWYVHGQRDIYGPFKAPPDTDVRVELQLSYALIQCDVNPTLTVFGYTEDFTED